MLSQKLDQPLERCREIFHLKNRPFVNALSECYATCLLLFIGIGIVFQFDLTSRQLNTWIQINIGWGFAITFCVYTISHTSGGHLNPAISLMFYTFGRISFLEFIYNSIGQFVGAFVGTLLAYLLYYDQVTHFLHGVKIAYGVNATATLFTSMPGEHVSNITAFYDQFVGTGFLALFVAVIVDKRNEIPAGIHALLVGFVIAMIGMAFGMNVGYPINPARDFSPRLFAYLIGYGPEVFTAHDNYWWIPFFAPFPGALIGAWSYYLFVGFHIEDHPPQVLKSMTNKFGELETNPEMKPLAGETEALTSRMQQGGW
ncbi:hypothetical protein AB6A40_000492 [Gnathostoma spinigerum]|uniref:Aquaporin n=1 Tax=Gnathostoma spinigerum TaxID=75299 RepID=A0ABD6EAK5_9BILA